MRLLRHVLAALLPIPALSNVYTYDASPLPPDVISYRRVGMWAPEEAPTTRGHSRAESSSISIALNFHRASSHTSGVVQVLVFHADQLPRVGTTVYGRRTYCCSASLAARGRVPGCSTAGQLIIAPETPLSAPLSKRHHPHPISGHSVTFAANQSTASLSQRVLVRQSGVHYLVLSSCDLRTGTVTFSGQTTWRNPHGYLPAELFPFLPFFGGLTAAYVVLSFIWAFQCIRHWSALLPLQTAIAAVLFLSVVESATWFASYRAFNEGGTRGLVPTVLGVLASTTRRTVVRLLVLAVCTGYGVVRPSLGALAPRIALLGCLYFVTSLALDVASNVTRLDELSLPARLLFVLPVGGLDGFYFWWCGSALSRTLSQLSSRRQSAKLDLYRRFAHVLLALLLVSALWGAWQMAFLVSGSQDSAWQLLWTFDAFWHALYALVLVTICVLWAPSRNNMRYAYMDEVSGMEPEDADYPEGHINDDGDSTSADGSSKGVPPYKVGTA